MNENKAHMTNPAVQGLSKEAKEILIFLGIRALTRRPLKMPGDSAFVHSELEAYEFALKHKDKNIKQVPGMTEFSTDEHASHIPRASCEMIRCESLPPIPRDDDPNYWKLMYERREAEAHQLSEIIIELRAQLESKQ